MRKAIAVFFIIISIFSINSVYATNTNAESEIISNETKSQLVEIKEKELKIGDHVIIQKQGDVIPEVVDVLKDKRNGTQKDFVMPKAANVLTPAIPSAESPFAF